MRILVLIATLVHVQSLVSSELDLCPKQDDVDATLVALLPLHRGLSCNQVRLKSLQQMAAAQLAIRESNNADSGEGVSIGLQVMDTCSSEKRAVKMAFKALVLTDTTICKKAPLLLGFLGPDDSNMLSAVQKVTGVFHLTHVAPLSLSNYPSDSPNFYHVTTVNQAEKVRAVLKLVKQVQWTAISIIHSSDRDTSQLVSAIMSANSAPCVAVVRPLPSEGLDAPGLLAEMPTVGVVVIASAEQLEDLLPYLSSDSHSFILVSSEAGVLPSLSLIDLTSSVMVMQETTQTISGLKEQLSKSPLWDEYLHQQRCNHSSCSNMNPDTADFGLIQGASVVPMSQAVRLYARAFKIAHKLKCAGRYGRCSALNNLSPEEWRSILGSASDRGIRFQMEQRTTYQLFYKQQFSHEIQKVGNISEGGRQIALLNSIKMPASHYALCNGGEDTDVALLTTALPAPPTKDIIVHKDLDTKFTIIHDTNNEDEDDSKEQVEEDRPFFGGVNFDIFDMKSYNTVELVAALTAFAILTGLIFALLIYIVYSNFKVKGNDDQRSRGGSSRRSSVRSV